MTTGTVTVECGWEDSLVDVFDGLAQLRKSNRSVALQLVQIADELTSVRETMPMSLPMAVTYA